jgi:hypothetical protein
MDVRYFLTAKYAEQSIDGTLNLLGVSPSVIAVPTFPHLMPNLYVAACLVIDRVEARTPHHVWVTFTAPDDQLIYKSEDMATEPREFPGNREFMQFNVALNLQNLLFPSEGLYRFHLFFDGEMAKGTTIRLEPKSESRIEQPEVVTSQ